MTILCILCLGSFGNNGYCISTPGENKISSTKDGEQLIIPLSGEWNFKLDPDKIGVEEKWYTQKLAETVVLPGTTDENKKGTFLDERRDDRLSRVYYWKGAAIKLSRLIFCGFNFVMIINIYIFTFITN